MMGCVFPHLLQGTSVIAEEGASRPLPSPAHLVSSAATQRETTPVATGSWPSSLLDPRASSGDSPPICSSPGAEELCLVGQPGTLCAHGGEGRGGERACAVRILGELRARLL